MIIDKLSSGSKFVGGWFRGNAKLLIACFAVGLICHFQMYSQGSTVFDGVASLCNDNGYGWYVSGRWDIGLGRWGLLLASWAKQGLCSPVLVSAITLGLFSIGAVVLVGLLGIKETWLKYVTAFLLICAPFISGCVVYYYCSNSYALCFMSSILAVALLGKPGGKCGIGRGAGASLLLMFALGCYQSSMGVFCVAGLLLLLADFLRRNQPKQTLAHFGKLIVVLALGTALYLAVNATALAVTGTSMNDYGGASSVDAGNIIAQLPSSLALVYTSFAALMFGNGVFGNGFCEPKVMLLFAAVAFVLLVVVMVKRGKNGAVGSMLAMACIALIPLAANIVLIADPDYGSPTIPMVGGFVCSLALLPVLAQLCCAEGDGMEDGVRSSGVGLLDESVRKVVYVASCVPLVFLAWSYALQCNADSEVMGLERNQVQSLATRAVDALESNAAVQAGATVLIAGTPQQGNYSLTSSFSGTTSDYARYGMICSDFYNNNYRCWRALTMEYAGTKLNLCSIDVASAIVQSAEFRALSNFPSDGCIAEINGVVVLKFSEMG